MPKSWRGAAARRALVVAASTLALGGVVPRARDCADPASDCTLRETAALSGARIGSAVPARLLDGSDPLYLPTLAAEFNSLTAENEMKWAATEPARGVFEFGGADALVEFAEAHGMRVRGHNLIWDQLLVDSTPAYVTAIADPQELRDLMADHIGTVVGRWRGRVDAWDVVNEPLESLGSDLYRNRFYELLGPGYIAEAFDLAHAADPDAVLFLNEVLVEFGGPKAQAFRALVEGLVGQGAPIGGVGLQAHLYHPFLVPKGEELRAYIRSFTELGLVVELTELDVPLLVLSALFLEDQAAIVRNTMSACLVEPGCGGVTFWGFTDRHTWIDSFVGPGLLPLPFDADYARKPAYYAARDALRHPALAPDPPSCATPGARRRP